MGAVRNVVFDVGRVLIRWELRCLFEKLIDDEAELEWFLANVVTEQWHHRHDMGEPLAELLAERKREFPGYDGAIDAYATRFAESIPGPVPGSLALLGRLDKAGVPLFAITNFASTFWAEFRATMPAFDAFRGIVVSGDEGIAKPDPAIFRLAARRFGIAPGESLFIDDMPANVAAAESLGWHGHRFIDAATLEADLAERGLLPG